uniref:Uncharacterized protein n=1 Tax=Bionectria ochroleuca TaxID=29856 RepID=A0A8H7TSN3_BIOOC
MVMACELGENPAVGVYIIFRKACTNRKKGAKGNVSRELGLVGFIILFVSFLALFSSFAFSSRQGYLSRLKNSKHIYILGNVERKQRGHNQIASYERGLATFGKMAMSCFL